MWDELKANPEVLYGAGIAFLVVVLRRLQNAGAIAEPLVGQQEAKRFEAELTLADMGMAVDAGAQTFLRVVQVKDSQ